MAPQRSSGFGRADKLDFSPESLVPLWELGADALVAQFLLATDGDGRLLAIEGGVVTEDAPRELRAREFRELLEVLQKAARELDARLYDHQLGRFLVGDHDFEAAVAGFA